MSGFPPQTLEFLANLTLNNEKPWFDAHREDYDQYYVAPAREFVVAMGTRLRKLSKTVQFAPKVGGSMMRINRDTRFSKDKTPYKTSLSLWFWEGQARRDWEGSGFWFSLNPRQISLGIGVYMFPPEQLTKFRKRIADDKTGKPLEKALAQLKKNGVELGGEKYKRVPKPYAPEHPRGELLKHQGFYAYLEAAPPRELSSPKFVEWCAARWQKMLPLHEWLRAIG
jgi:uncharacterized protein (TIGR02453 family)